MHEDELLHESTSINGHIAFVREVKLETAVARARKLLR